MATLYVDGSKGNDSSGDGSSAKPWKSLRQANSRVRSGDTVLVRSATYSEILKIDTPNTTWKADEGHTPTMDGRYSPSELKPDGTMPGPDEKSSYLPGSEYGTILSIAADDVTVSGFLIRNIAGRPVGISGKRAKLLKCTIDFVYSGAIVADGAHDVLIEGVNIYRCNQKRYDPHNEGEGPANVQVTLILKGVNNGVVRKCDIAYNHGEGISVELNSKNCIIEQNSVHTNLHMHIVMNHAQNNIIRNNFIYHSNDPEFVQRRSGDPPNGIVISDELKRGKKFNAQRSEGNVIYNNIVVGLGQNFEARYSKNSAGALRRTYVGYNTFVNAFKSNRTAVNIRIPPSDEHVASVFENNIIIQDSGGTIAQVPGGNSILFRNNVWSDTPSASAKGPGDKVGNPGLLNHTAILRDGFGRQEMADPNHYKLTQNSRIAINTAVNGGQANGIPLPPVTQDFFLSRRTGAFDIGAHEFDGVIDQTGLVPTAQFSVSGPATGKAPHTVQFIDDSTGDVERWLWEFGDGESSTERQPKHVYEEPGSYSVKLTVSNRTGSDVELKEDFITVLKIDIDDEIIIPKEFRRFYLADLVTNRLLACGTQYPDLSCVLVWSEEPFHMVNYNSIKDVSDIHLSPGATSLLWMDEEKA